MVAERRNAFIIAVIIVIAGGGIGTMFVIKHSKEKIRPVLPAAAIELQAGNYPKAAEFLGAVRGLLSSDLFNSLMSEPPLVEHAANPTVTRFFSETSAQR